MKLTRRIVASLQQRLVAALAVFFLCGAAAASASDDPPGRVGRLGEMTGQVWFYSPDAGEWVTAVRNRPLTTGDRLSTDTAARADVRIGSTSVRLDSGTELEILGIDDEHIALQLHSGSIATRLRSAEAAREFELRTGEGRIVTHRAGRYRFDRQDENTHVTVWSGEALYEGPGSALTINAGQRAEFWLQGSAAQYSITEPEHDAFAAWSADRDRSEERSASSRYVSPEMTGAEDLDRYGRWEQAPEYGTVWVPRHVPRGWAPYGAGHWTWVSPWGWTWVDDMPWGFAPFHYGRWAWFRNNWCWVPGSFVRRPVYAPALVGWIGGPHVNVSISVGSRRGPGVGWFPLAPREVYVPSYRVTPGYVQQVNVTHVTHISNVTTIVNNPQNAVTRIDYRNRRHPHAVTVVPQEVMTGRRPVAPVASQLRATSGVQRLVNQPGQNVVVSAPPVAAPVVPPAAREQRRMRIHEGADGRSAAAHGLAPTAVVPPSPLREASPIVRGDDARGSRAEQEERERRRDRRDDRGGTPGMHVPQRDVVTAAPAASVQVPTSNAAAAERAPRMRMPVAPAPAATPPVTAAQPPAPAPLPRPPVTSPMARPAPDVVQTQRMHSPAMPAVQQRAAPAVPSPRAPVTAMPAPPAVSVAPAARAVAPPAPPAEVRSRSHGMPQARQPNAAPPAMPARPQVQEPRTAPQQRMQRRQEVSAPAQREHARAEARTHAREERQARAERRDRQQVN